MATRPRLAPSLVTLRSRLNEISPLRQKKHDGWIGDAAHQSRASDHNPDARGIVRAIDVTDDTDGRGTDLDALWLREALRRGRDQRIKYVISEGQMFSAYPTSAHPAWTWRPYHGDNKHFQHVHVSVLRGPAGDRAGSWALTRDLGAPVRFLTIPAATDPLEDDVTPEELTAAVRVAVHGLLKEAAAPEPTPTGRQVRDFLTQILTPSMVAGVWGAEFGAGARRQSAGQRLAIAAAPVAPVLAQDVLDQLNDEAAGRVPSSVNADPKAPVEG